MAIVIRLTEYLNKLEEKEATKEGPRLQVPTITELSDETKIHYSTLNRIVRNRVTRLDLPTVDQIIITMRNRGFDMNLTDFMTWEESLN